MTMQHPGWILVVIGVLIAGMGLIWLLGPSLPWLGKLPGDIRIATVWYRPTKKTLQTPEYYVHKTDEWLVLPYELSGFTIDELRANRPEMSGLLDRLATHVKAG